MTDIIKGNNGNVITAHGKPYAAILSLEGVTDTFVGCEAV